MARVISLNNLTRELNQALSSSETDIREKADRAIRIAVIKIWVKIIRMTPVDTGRARGNWFIGMSPGNDITRGTNRRDARYIESKLPAQLLGNKTYLYNNLPYIEKLEFGSSTQAPTGMVRVSLRAWSRELQSAFRAVQ